MLEETIGSLQDDPVIAAAKGAAEFGKDHDTGMGITIDVMLARSIICGSIEKEDMWSSEVRVSMY